MYDENLELDYKDLVKIRTGVRKAFGHSAYKKHFIESLLVKVDRYKADNTLHKVPYSKYKCNCCNDLFSIKDIDVDHIEEIGYMFYTFKNVEQFIRRVFCDYSNLQLLCKTCHTLKTKAWTCKGYKNL